MLSMKINVATNNPIKTAATEQAFRAAFPNQDLEVESVRVDSGVSVQPSGNEIVRGAANRARRARGNADYGVGIESGLIKLPGTDQHFNIQFCALVSRTGEFTMGHSSGFQLPENIVAQLQNGKVLNQTLEQIFPNTSFIAQAGAVGCFSHGRIDRETLIREAVLMALIPHIHNYS